MPLFIHFIFDGYLNFFHFQGVTNNTSMNFLVLHIFWCSLVNTTYQFFKMTVPVSIVLVMLGELQFYTTIYKFETPMVAGLPGCIVLNKAMLRL